jgi:flagellum-specific ATP synthase
MLNRESFVEKLSYLSALENSPSVFLPAGTIVRVVGQMLEAKGCHLPIRGRCFVEISPDKKIECEVVGFSESSVYLMPFGEFEGILPYARVYPSTKGNLVPFGDGLLGRVLDGMGNPIDGKGALSHAEYKPAQTKAINPLNRKPIHEVLDVGIRSVNALLSIGKGQRMGLFAGSGVGKSVLMGMMTKYTEADITVVGLVGERGREVKEFIQEILGEDGLSKAVVVASPADDSPLLRINAAYLATSIAEHFRDQGKNVLLLLDSLTRFAQAQREIALSVGEPPATKGYPPSVFSKVPHLVERAGNSDHEGSITAIYTVLMDGDDSQDPVADCARAILDGHILLSRDLAEQGIYPAVDLEASISRVMPSIVSADRIKKAIQFKKLYSSYQRAKDLIQIGAYARGSDPDVDLAIQKYPEIIAFLSQTIKESFSYKQSIDGMDQVVGVS